MRERRYPSTAAEIEEAAWLLPDDERVKWLEAVREMFINHAILTEAERQTLLRRATETAIAIHALTFETGFDPWREWAEVRLSLMEAIRRRPRPSKRADVQQEIEEAQELQQQGLTLHKIAEKQGIEYQTLVKRLHRARKRART
jgi:hypothetical protein